MQTQHDHNQGSSNNAGSRTPLSVLVEAAERREAEENHPGPLDLRVATVTDAHVAETVVDPTFAHLLKTAARQADTPTRSSPQPYNADGGPRDQLPAQPHGPATRIQSTSNSASAPHTAAPQPEAAQPPPPQQQADAMNNAHDQSSHNADSAAANTTTVRSSVPVRPLPDDDAFFASAPKLYIPGQPDLGVQEASEPDYSMISLPEENIPEQRDTAPQAHTLQGDADLEARAAAAAKAYEARQQAATQQAQAAAANAGQAPEQASPKSVTQEEAEAMYDEAIAKAQHELAMEKVQQHTAPRRTHVADRYSAMDDVDRYAQHAVPTGYNAAGQTAAPNFTAPGQYPGGAARQVSRQEMPPLDTVSPQAQVGPVDPNYQVGNPVQQFPGSRHGFPTEAHRERTGEAFNQRVQYNEQSQFSPAQQRYTAHSSPQQIAESTRTARGLSLHGGLRDHLVDCGFPQHLMAGLSQDAGMEELLPLLSTLPRCDLPLANPGMVAIVVGQGSECREVGARLSRHLECPRSGNDEVLLADRPDVARAQARSIRIGTGSGVVGVTVRPYDQDPAYVAKTIAATSPGVVIACVDATRKQADSRSFLRGLASSGINVSGLAVTNARNTVEPAAVLELGLPVWEIDGAMADNLSWLPLLLKSYQDSQR